MATPIFSFTEIGVSTTGVHALHDEAINQIESFLGAVLEIDSVDGSTEIIPTAAQALGNGVFKIVNDGVSPPISDTVTLFDTLNFPTRAFAVWNAMTVNVLTVEYNNTSSTFDMPVGHSLLPGELGYFYFDNATNKVYRIDNKPSDAVVIDVNVVDTGIAATAVYAGQSIGGHTLVRGDWALITDVTKGPFIAPAATADARGYHPRSGIPTYGTPATPVPYTTTIRCTEGDNAGKFYKFDGTDWVEAVYFAGTGKNLPAQIGFFYPGVPPVSTVIWEYVATDAVTIADDYSGSRGNLRTGPSGGSISFDTQKNGTNNGNMDFASAATTSTFATDATTVTLAAGDRLAVSTPADLRSAADLSVTFKITRD